jgi:tetratricopeptide (TPR) repeat protein
VLRQQGDFEAAKAHYEAALAVARQAGNRNEELRIINSLAFLDKVRGDLRGAADKLLVAARGFAAAGDRAGEAGAISNLGIVLAAEGRLAAAEQSHRQALALYRDIGARDRVAEEMHRAAEVLRYQGRDEQARREHEEALALRRELGDAGAVARSQLALGRLLLDRGRPEEAESIARLAAREFDRVEARDFAAEAWAVVARAGWEAGRREEAGGALERARALAAGSRDSTVAIAVAMVEAHLAAGDPARAAGRLEAALGEARGTDLPLELEARLALARLRLAAGEGNAARADLEALLAAAQRSGIELVRRQAQAALEGERR